MVSLRDLVSLVWISFGLGSVLCAVLATEYERTLVFKEPIPDKALPGHVIRTEQVLEEGSCRVKYYMEPNCVSINVGPGKQGQLTCELNNHTDETPPHSSLEERKHYIHYAAENFCHGDLCPDKFSVCQVGFTNRGYRCACREGYITTGDHGQCQDVDECRMPDYGHCSPNADCINQPGSFECKCKSGYVGDGVKCDDLNECYTSDANNCSINADCVNKPGTFECNCRPGYTGNGVVCNDIDECKEGSQDCSPCAVCSNVPGSFGCSCKSEFTGDGKTCTVLCPSSSWTSYGSSCYKLFTTPETWYQADAICRSNCGLLVKIESAGENKFIEDRYLAGRTVDYWIGLTDAAIESDWKWSDGTGLTSYKNWGPNQPNDVNNQDCGGIRMGIHFSTNYDAQWHDNGCLETKGFICEMVNRK